jgi:Zn/Cd-binding protein ZinT
MRKATIEVLKKDEKVLGSPTIGRYHVLEYQDDEQVGGQFFETMKEANKHVSQYIQESDDE